MRFWKIFLPILMLLGGLGWWGVTLRQEAEAAERRQDIRDMLERQATDRLDFASPSIAAKWAHCLERLQSGEFEAPPRSTCDSGTGQGVTSALIAVRFEDGFVPVIESWLENSVVDGRVVVHIVGGPGDDPFYSNPNVTQDMADEFRDNEIIGLTGGIMDESPEYRLMQRGFTIASIGYWGTSLRTLNEPNEIELAIREVGQVIDHYAARLGEEPPLMTASLGTHLALGALGKERLQGMRFLALVPVMDGLQHHLQRLTTLEEWNSPDPLDGAWQWRNVYARSDAGVGFDHRRMMDEREFNPRYIGEADLPWRDITPQESCSAIILGESDPRTSAYLAANDTFPDYVQVWQSDHYLMRDAPDQVRALFADFGDCLLAEEV